MRTMRNNRYQESEKGVALLISIFALMLISAVAISLVLMSGTGSAIDSNYRNSTKAFYSAYAGLEEVRGRLAPKRLDTIFNQLPNPMLVSPTVQVQYILNPAAGENVTPTVAGSKYADTEFANEWGAAAATEVVLPTAIYSDYALGGVPGTVAGLNGPSWKWVRITGLTEAAANTDVDGNNDCPPCDLVDPIFYLNGNRYVDTPVNAANPAFQNGTQVYRLTSLSVMPDGSRRMLQYDVAIDQTILKFPSALTLPGQNIAFSGANSNQWYANGTDGSGAGNNSSYVAVPGCAPTTTSLPSVGVTDTAPSTTNLQTVKSGMPRPTHYTGGGMTSSSVSDVTLNPDLSTPSQLDQLVQTIYDSSNLTLGPPLNQVSTQSFTQSNLPSSMSASNPQVVVVNGDFSMTGNFTGYGVLVVTGNFAYSGTTGWDGIVLVVGEGSTTFLGSGGGNAGFNGAIFVATTKDSSGNELSSLGNVNFGISGGGGNGIYYDNCWINNSQNNFRKFTVLSFREILNF